jgi:hypothetical protein
VESDHRHLGCSAFRARSKDGFGLTDYASLIHQVSFPGSTFTKVAGTAAANMESSNDPLIGASICKRRLLLSQGAQRLYQILKAGLLRGRGGRLLPFHGSNG